MMNDGCAMLTISRMPNDSDTPAVTAAYPVLLDIFGGSQSARTIHFFAFAALVLFLVVHVAMVVLTGFKRQMHAMILGD